MHPDAIELGIKTLNADPGGKVKVRSLTSGVNAQCLLVETLIFSVSFFVISSRRGFEYSALFRVGRGGRAYIYMYFKKKSWSVKNRCVG